MSEQPLSAADAESFTKLQPYQIEMMRRIDEGQLVLRLPSRLLGARLWAGYRMDALEYVREIAARGRRRKFRGRRTPGRHRIKPRPAWFNPKA